MNTLERHERPSLPEKTPADGSSGPSACLRRAAYFARPASLARSATFAPETAAAAAFLCIALICMPTAGGGEPPGKKDGKAGQPKTGLVLFDPFDDESAPSPFGAWIDHELSFADTGGSCRGVQIGGAKRWSVVLSGPGRGAARGTAPGPLFATADSTWLAMRVYVEKVEGVTVELRSAEEQPRSFSAAAPAAKPSDWSLILFSRTDFKDRDGGELAASVPILSIQISASAAPGAAAGEVRLAVDNVAVMLGVPKEEAEKLYAEAEKDAIEDSRKRRAVEALRKEVTFDFDKTGLLLGLPAVENLKARRSAARGAERGTVLKIGGTWAADARFLDLSAKGGGKPGEDGGRRENTQAARAGVAYRLVAAKEVSGLSNSSDARKTVEKALDALRPETAAIIFDFDELFRGTHPYELYSNAAFAAQACLIRGCVPVIFTPPVRQMPKGSDGFYLQKSAAILMKELAERMRVPMVDAFTIANRGDEASARNFSADGRLRGEVSVEIEEAFLALYRKLAGYAFEREAENVAGSVPAEPAGAREKGSKAGKRVTDDE